MKLAWMNDLHLEFARWDVLQAFFGELKESEADCFLVGGDISQAPMVCTDLALLASTLERPVHFVLGNHDFYKGSIEGTRSRVCELDDANEILTYLSRSGPIPLGPNAVLVGHDGWGDARFGDFEGSPVMLNDFLLIEELAGRPREELRPVLEELGDEAARHFRAVLPRALELADHVVVLTHVPPWIESAWHRGEYSDDNWLPFFSCKAAGDVLRETMENHPDKSMTVLCGHTHGGGTSEILPNLVVQTGAAKYKYPALQGVIEV
jgi:3',5'-cyclic AMP phosphodiesterase CpdA